MSRRTLITIGIALTVVAFVAADADFWSDPNMGHHDNYHSTTLLTSFRVSHRGEIELDESQTSIVAMSPDAALEVRERRLFTRRSLSVRADASGRPRYDLTVGARERSEAEAREFLADVMPGVVRSTTIGARPRARRLLETRGLEALLREVPTLDSNAARRIYIEEAVTLEGLTEAQGLQIIRTAGREINSSSRLRLSLIHLAEELPDEWSIGGELAVAAENIASSSEKSAALIEIVRLRGLDAESAKATAEALETIAASSEKSRAIVRIARLEPRAEIVEILLGPIDTIDSSSERRRALDELVAYPDLWPSAYERALDIGSEIASSSEKASFLSALAESLPADEALQQHYIRVASSIAASSEQSRALLALMRATELPGSSCAAWIETSGDVAAGSVAASLLVESAATCPSEAAVWRAYLSAVRRIAASSEQRRVLMALLDRADLNAGLVGEISMVAEESIASTSEREAVVDRARQVLGSAPLEMRREEPVEPAGESDAELPVVPAAGDEVDEEANPPADGSES